MLALKSYEQTTGFSVLNTDELFFINGGSGTGSGESSYGIRDFIYDFVYIAVKEAQAGDNEYTEQRAREIAEKVSGKKK